MRPTRVQVQTRFCFQNRASRSFLTWLEATRAINQGKPFTTRTAPSKVRMARGNAIQMLIQAASATRRDRKPLAANELFVTLLRDEEEKVRCSCTPSQRAGRHHGRDHHLRLAAHLDGGAERLGAEGWGV